MNVLILGANGPIARVDVGNDKQKLIAVVTQLLPCIGYPRALSALSCVNEVIPEGQR